MYVLVKYDLILRYEARVNALRASSLYKKQKLIMKSSMRLLSNKSKNQSKFEINLTYCIM